MQKGHSINYIYNILKRFNWQNFSVSPSTFICKYAQSSNPFGRKIECIYDTCRFIDSPEPKGTTHPSCSGNKQRDHRSCGKTPAYGPTKRPVGRFNRRVRSVKCCYIPANSSDNPHRSLLPYTFHPLLFRRTPSRVIR